MSTATPIPETCRIFLDSEPLPKNEDGGTLPVPLSPLTITWGASTPWDETTPNVLKITLIDQGGRYARTGDTLLGHRITVTPEWKNTNSPLPFCLFDGVITDTDIIPDKSRHRLNITASDRLYLLRTDCRKGPNWNQNETMVQGFQWWPKGDTTAQFKQWIENDGINGSWFPWSTHIAGIKSDERSSLLNWAESLKTRQINNKYMFEIDRMLFMSYQNINADVLPSFEAVYLRWTTETVLTGPYIRTGDDNTDIYKDTRYIDAADVLTDPKPTLTGADSYYTQLELRYSHLKLATSSGQQIFEVVQDGSSVKQIATPRREGETCLSVTLNWADSGAAQNNISVVDTSRAETVLKTQNERVRLPEVTFRGDRLNQLFFFCRPRVIVIVNSMFERTTRATHGPWAIIGGTLTYDVTNQKSHWTHKVRLFPAVDASSGGTPTCGELKQINSKATFAAANWTLGGLRYVTKTGDEPV
ncbi:hypothetical protein BREU_1262 [Bifidobacterium reuteri DSM 23975]|uniref:Uncharacterized protein n=1 Tax=Bifidobacterium reuteri DSM 23975 TaxID=1437610 RepID=A0A087CMI7_9BIFI|nr:hypothetical protein [Bifidobacterium reuteri]KFI84487.1 hypothetical protein BREU_1262 [Bifidobacterium reuteri DSM 23975]